MRTLLKTLDHSLDPDRGPSPSPVLDCGVVECGKGSCGVDREGGGGSGSDRAETLGGGARSGREDDGKEGGDMQWSSERERCDWYEPRRTRFESRWAPWGMSASGRSGSRSPEKRRSPSPEKRRCPSPETVFSTWLTDEEEKDGEKENLESPPTLTPTAVVVAEEPALRVGAGLMNLGNTCFLNAVLQCLVHTSPLLQGLFMVKHPSPCFREIFCLICTLREHVQRAFSSNEEISPYGIVNNLKYFSVDFVRFQQEDAHEFLQCLLDKLEKYPICSVDLFSVTPSHNLVKQVFGGSLISRLRCCECNHISCTPEDLIDFSLEIDNVNTLHGALESFTKLEKIDDIKLTCDGCNKKVSMEKQFMVDKAPLVASVHLKRFKNDGICIEKISKHVEYPLSLNLQPYTVGHQEHNVDLMYDLYAVIVHTGSSLSTGHYYCFVRSSSNTWHEFDDSMVTRVSESHVLSQEVYILFYAKHGTFWFTNVNEVPNLCAPIISKFSPSSVLDNVNQSSESDSSTENPYKYDVRVNRHKDSDSTCQPACFGPQREVVAEGNGHVKYSDLLLKGEDDGKNEMDVYDSSFNFDMLKDVGNNERMEEKVEATQVQPCNSSILNNKKCAAPPSLAETSNVTNNNMISPGGVLTLLPRSLAVLSGSSGEGKNVRKKNTIISSGDLTEPSSSQTDLVGSPEDVKVEKPMLRKRSAEKPIEDPRKKQVLKNLRRTNVPMSRASKLLASMTLSPNKKKKPLVSLVK